MRKPVKYALVAAALAALVAVLVFVNLPAKRAASGAEVSEQAASSDLAIGARVGEQLPDFTVECLDGSAFSLRQQRGKVVVINLWATWCGPCVQELPNFDRLQREHPTDAAVLAVHTSSVTKDVPAYLSAYSYEIPFAVDEDGSLGALLNASNALPQTIILDPDGVVTYNQPGALSYETLLALVAEAANRSCNEN